MRSMKQSAAFVWQRPKVTHLQGWKTVFLERDGCGGLEERGASMPSPLMLAAQWGSVSGSANPSVFVSEGGGGQWQCFKQHPRGEDCQACRHVCSPEPRVLCEATLPH